MPVTWISSHLVDFNVELVDFDDKVLELTHDGCCVWHALDRRQALS